MGKEAINKLLANLAAVFRNVQLYAPDHPLVRKSIARTLDSLNDIFNAANESTDLHEQFTDLNELTFMIIENEIIVKDMQLDKLSSASLSLAKMLKSKGIEWISLVKGLNIDELTEFASSFIKLQKVEAIKASAHIKIGTVSLKTTESGAAYVSGGQEVEGAEELEEGYEYVRRGDFLKIEALYSSAKRHKKLNIVGIESIVGQFMTSFKRDLSPLLSMSSLKSYDQYTYVHAANVCILTMAQAETLGVAGNILHDIGIASMVHDVGKTFIPDVILNKAGKLSKEEWEIMTTHPTEGAKYLSNMPGIPNLAVLVAFEHHMKPDFSGYPKVSETYKLHPCSLMTNIADVYDALSTVRPYRDPMPREKVYSILREDAKSELSSFLVENFIDMVKSAGKPGV